MRAIPIIISIGFLLAAYASYVEYRAAQATRMGTKYRALCDIGMFSCTKVFSSEFGHFSQFLGLPRISNAIVGMIFYAVELVLERHTNILLLMSGASCLGSLVLFYVLTVKMHDFCIVCFSIYAVNFATFLLALRRHGAQSHMHRLEDMETDRKKRE